jgi:serine/threonine-protein kinase
MPDGAIACPHCGERHPPSYTHCPRTGKPLTSGRALVGRVIAGRYRIVGLLGEGGMGAVYAAEHKLLKHKVAMKRLHPELASDDKAVRRFQREAQAAAATGHDNVVKVIDMGFAEDGAPFIVMEYLKGRSLAATLRREGRLAPARACHVVGQVLAALSAVHASGIVHRDLKPDNVFLIRREGRGDWVKVLDFGISKMRVDGEDAMDLTRTGVMLGTPFYMSPEQARGMKDLDHRVDIYAAGVILYECLSGRLPFEGQNYHALLQQILSGTPTPVGRFSEVDERLARLVERALARDRAMRFSTAGEMLRALLPYGASDAQTATPSPDVSTTTGSSAPTFPLHRPPPDDPSRSTGGFGEERLSSDGHEDIETTLRSLPRPVRVLPAPRRFVARSADWEDHPPSRSVRRRRVQAPRPHARMSAPPADWVDSEPPPADAAGEDPTPDSLLGGTPDDRGTQVKGSLLLTTLDHLEQAHGREAHQRILSRIPPAHRARLSGVVMPVAWFPLEVFDDLLTAAEREIGNGDGAVASAIGAAVAERELPTTHRLFMQRVNPKLAVERIPQLLCAYHDGPTATITRPLEHSARVELVDLSPDTLLHAMCLCGFYQRLVALAGGLDVRTALLSSRGRGDERTVISLRWK